MAGIDGTADYCPVIHVRLYAFTVHIILCICIYVHICVYVSVCISYMLA